MTWNDITVFQWQQLSDLKDLDEVDMAIKATAIVTGKTEMQVQQMTLLETKELSSQLAFMATEIPLKRVNYINANGNRYKVNYDVRRMAAGRYIEAKHFANDFAGNIHRLAACMVIPMKKTIFGYQEIPFDASKHEEYANDLQMATITDVMGSVVFFYHVFKIWIKVFKDYLKSEMQKMGMNKYQSEVVYHALCSSLDGFIKHQSWQNMKGFRLNKSTI